MDLPKHDPNILRTMKDDVTTFKHHYIPRFYLNGFTDDQGMLYRYDKLTGDIKYVGKKGVFWEENLNTAVLTHPKTGEMHLWDFPEHLFAGLDSRFAEPLENLRNTDATTRIMDSPAAVDTVKGLIHFLFWRAPANKDLLDKIIDESSFKTFGFGFFDAAGNRSTEWEEKMKDIDVWRKLYPALISVGRSYSTFKKSNNIDWDIYYMDGNNALATDNPIILRSFHGPPSLEGDLLFPLSSKMLVVALQGKKKPTLPVMIRVQTDVLLFHQARRYVASPSKKYINLIKDLVDCYNEDVPNWPVLIKEHIFRTLT